MSQQKTWEQFIEVAKAALHQLKRERTEAEPTKSECWLFALVYAHYMDQGVGPGPLREEFGEEFFPTMVD